MDPKVRELPDNLINQIAAGEIVERPASVVKELIENAIDAGSTEISLEVKEGGKRLIRVVDNGCGMSRDNALLSIERHTTSKLREAADLIAIRSLGFRGEALPSIASVSRFEITTKDKASPVGTRIKIEGGKLGNVEEVASPVGTVVEAGSLFFNLPARKKFLKSATTEFGHISELLNKVAMVYPSIHFTLSHNKRVVHRFVPSSNPRDRLGEILGKETSRALHPVDYARGPVKVEGWISEPGLTRSSPRQFSFFVNGRPIRDRSLNHAVLEAYRTLLMKDRYPVVIIFLYLPFDFVDVNVHPSKHEIRFRDPGLIHHCVVEASRQTLRQSPWMKKTVFEVAESSASFPSREDSRKSLYQERVEGAAQRYMYSREAGAPRQKDMPWEPKTGKKTEAAELAGEGAEIGRYAGLHIIGQLGGEFILCESREGLVLIDQHAAAERLSYRRLRQAYEGMEFPLQTFLIPETIELTPSEKDLVERFSESFVSVGVHLEPFGGNTVSLKAVPAWLEGANYLQLVEEILDHLKGSEDPEVFPERIDHILMTMACHSVVRGTSPLSREEMQALFVQLDQAGAPSTCPHGRPIAVAVSWGEIERRFKRT